MLHTLLLIAVMQPALAQTTPTGRAQVLSDATIAPWARAAVARLSEAGVAEGDGKGGFHGGKIAARYDALLMLGRMLRVGDLSKVRSHGKDVALFAALTPHGSERAMGLTKLDIFKDIDIHCWGVMGEIFNASSLSAYGIVQGDPDIYFRGRRSLRRGELAMICARIILLGGNEAPTDVEKAHFSDLAGDEWYYGAAVVACGSGVMQGDGARTFRASRPVTRNELAVVLDRLSPYLNRSGTLRKP